jgi:hypothetical protein
LLQPVRFRRLRIGFLMKKLGRISQILEKKITKSGTTPYPKGASVSAALAGQNERGQRPPTSDVDVGGIVRAVRQLHQRSQRVIEVEAKKDYVTWRCHETVARMVEAQE